MWSCVLAEDVAALLNGGSNFSWVMRTRKSLRKPGHNQGVTCTSCGSDCVRVKWSFLMSICLSIQLALQQSVGREVSRAKRLNFPCLCRMCGTIECVRDKVRNTESPRVIMYWESHRGAGSAPLQDTGTVWLAVFISFVLLGTCLLPYLFERVSLNHFPNSFPCSLALEFV